MEVEVYGQWNELTDEKPLYTALNNCDFVSTDNKNFNRSYEFLFDAAMLGVGFGFDKKGTNTLIYKPLNETYEYIIEDK